MKIGILTFHSAHNYGAVLQVYALQEIIKNFEKNIEIINYQPDYLIKVHLFPKIKNKPITIKIKLLLESVVCYKGRKKRRKGFENFINSKLQLSKKEYNHSFTSNNSYDAYVMGSDQIWNLELTKGFDDVYWGNFKTKKEALKLAYAPSMSNFNLTESQKEVMLNNLKKFTTLSVREEETKHFINQNFGIETVTVLDPTFLLDKKFWGSISKKPKVNKKFILVYTITLRENVMKIARSLAKKMDAEIIELSMGVDKNVISNNYQTATPEEFLGLFENAEFILTSSFHGTAFSIIFNKPFYSIAHGNDKDSRQKTILKKLGLINRFIASDEMPDFSLIDYEKTNNELENLRKDSVNYLKNSLLNK